MKPNYPFFCRFGVLLQNCGQAHKNTLANEVIKSGFYTVQDFKKVDKIDAHVHIETDCPDFIKQAIRIKRLKAF